MAHPLIVHAKCLDYLRTLPDASIDAVVTDPPYGLSNTSPDKVTAAITAWATGDREFVPAGRGFMSAEWDSFVPPPAVWDECLRVLRPGGHLVAFAGSRTIDLMTLSIRLAGFDIRDSLVWLSGSGMPHGQNVGKEIAKTGSDAWQGWNTSLKPAQEPIVLARKPLAERTAARNVLEHGTGALNIDATRIAHRSSADLAESTAKNQHADYGSSPYANQVYGDQSMLDRLNYQADAGRHPANVLLTHSPGCVQDGVTQVRGSGHHPARRGPGGIGSTGHQGQDDLVERHLDQEVVEQWQCAPGCPVAELDAQSGITKSTGGSGVGYGLTGPTYGDGTGQKVPGGNAGGTGDVGGASRFFLTTAAAIEDDPGFFYSAKAKTKERPTYLDEDGKRVQHVSVKPLAVMRWLVRMVTPPGGVVLDPFAGSGTTLEAAMLEGFDSIGIEQHGPYIPLIEQRVERSGPAA